MSNELFDKAFPTAPQNSADTNAQFSHGLSKFEYFAAAALPAVMEESRNNYSMSPNDIAYEACQYGQAMVEEINAYPLED